MNELDVLTPAQQAMQELLAEEMAGTLHCTVCQMPIPEARARRQTATCSEKCKNRLDVIRERQRAAKKCPACLHPSTPEEREAFRQWRAERGDITSASKRPVRDHSLPNKLKIAQTLRKAATALSRERDRVKAQLDAANAPEGLAGPGTGILGEDARAELASRVEMFTTLTSEAESVLTNKAQPE